MCLYIIICWLKNIYTFTKDHLMSARLRGILLKYLIYLEDSNSLRIRCSSSPFFHLDDPPFSFSTPLYSWVSWGSHNSWVNGADWAWLLRYCLPFNKCCCGRHESHLLAQMSSSHTFLRHLTTLIFPLSSRLFSHLEEGKHSNLLC